MNSITLIPAHGRDYKSQGAAKADFEAGKDFMISDMSSPYDGRHTSIRDLHGRDVYIRFNGYRAVVCIKVPCVPNCAPAPAEQEGRV